MADAALDSPFRVFAPAKLNLFLHVIDRRADGLHDVRSLIVFCDVGDEIEIAPADDLSLSVEGPFVAALGADNIVMRAARALRAERAPGCGAAIRLTKNLPVGAGLGGGSSDAAATLRVLGRLWNAEDQETLAHIAANLGADVPACLAARPVIVSGIGDRIEFAPTTPALALVLINPGVAVSTADVYARCQPTAEPRSVHTDPPSELTRLIGWLDERSNHLTAPARELAPEIGDVLEFLTAQPNCLLSRMSGSGATCFGLFEDLESAAIVAERAQQTDSRWWVVAATSLTGRPL